MMLITFVWECFYRIGAYDNEHKQGFLYSAFTGQWYKRYTLCEIATARQ